MGGGQARVREKDEGERDFDVFSFREGEDGENSGLNLKKKKAKRALMD